MPCAICGTRKPRRHCPASGTDICTICCATGREESIDCPLGCEHLRAGHQHEAKPEFDSSKLPNQDIEEVTESFLAHNEVLLAFIGVAVYEGALPHPATTDWDVREAFEALIQHTRAAQSGLVVESHPVNPYAAGVVDSVLTRLAEIKERETAANGSSTLTDDILLRAFAFMQRLEYSHNNGRKRCRAFLDLLGSFHGPEGGDAGDEFPEPEEPLVIL